MEEKLLHSELKFSGRILRCKLDTVSLPNGKEATREVVFHPGAVCVAALQESEVFLVKQYRHPVEKILWELPAGKLDPDEAPLVCAQRELHEETGLKAVNWQHLSTFFTTPGFSNETMHLYLATNLNQEGQCPDEDEFVEVGKFPLQEALAMIENGSIVDAKTIIGLYMAVNSVKRGTVPV